MRIIIAALLLTLGSCGVDTTQKKLKPLIGTSGMQSYFTDRNMTGEDLQNATNTVASKVDSGYVAGKKNVSDTYFAAGDKVGATKHKAAGYTGDRNITGDAFSKQAKDYTGKIRRKGEITKGYTSDRLDQIKDPDRKEREEIKDLQDRADVVDGRLSSAESRIAAEEAKSAAQALLIDQMTLANELRFKGLDIDIEDTQASVAALSAELEVKVNRLDMALTAKIDDLESYVDSENGLQDAAVAASIASLEADLLSLANYVDSENSSQDARIRSISRRVRGIARTAYRNSRNIRGLQRSLRCAQRAIRRLNGKVSDLEADMADVEDSIDDMADALSDAEDAIEALELAPDLVCSVTTSDVIVHKKYKEYHNHPSYYHWYTSWNTVTIPTVTCPSI